MSDDPVDYQKEEALRYRMETSKERSILIRNWIYTAIALIVAVMLIWALWSWKAANNMAAATQSKLNGILDRLDQKVDALDTAKLNALADNGAQVLASVQKRVDDLAPIEKNLAAATNTLNWQAHQIGNSVQGRLLTADGLLSDIRGVAQESQRQIKGNGDKAQAAIASANTLIKDADTKIARVLDNGAALIETANPRVAKLLDDFDVVVAGEDGLQGLVKKGNATMAEATATTHNISLMTGDLQKRTNQILFPPPDRGFTGFAKKFILRPITTFGGAAYLVERLIYGIP